jgi:hypothetical protein
MPLLHDTAVRDGLRKRLQAMPATAQRKWGSMTADQMLWHCADAMEIAMGRKQAARKSMPIPGPILRFLVLSAPWPKGAPTLQELVATTTHDFEAERKRCLALIDEFAARDVDGPWPVHATLGAMSGNQFSRLHAKHLNHHLMQFGS